MESEISKDATVRISVEVQDPNFIDKAYYQNNITVGFYYEEDGEKKSTFFTENVQVRLTPYEMMADQLHDYNVLEYYYKAYGREIGGSEKVEK